MTNLYGKLILTEEENQTINNLINRTESSINYLCRSIVHRVIDLNDDYAFTVEIFYNYEIHKVEFKITLHYGDKDIIKHTHYNELKDTYTFKSKENEIDFKIDVLIE